MNFETSLINAILTSENITPVIHKLQVSHFFNPTTKRIYGFLTTYFKDYKGVPTVAVIKENFPDFEYQIETTDTDYLIDKILEKKCESEVTDLILEATNTLKEKSGFAALDLIKKKTLKISQVTNDREDVDIIQDTEKRLNRYIEKAAVSGLTGVPCGFRSIDAITSGFQNGQLILIIGSPGIGKSFTAVFFALSAWKAGIKPLFISLEMSEKELADRFDSLMVKLSHHILGKGRLSQDDFLKYRTYLDELKKNKTEFIISTPARCTQSDILAMIEEHKPGICFVDYSRLVTDEHGEMDFNGVANVVRDLKGFARDPKVNIPIVVLNQVNRGFDRTKADLPEIHEVAHSFTAIQDSDIVFACHATDAMKEDKEMLLGIIKHRNGPNVKIWLHWDLDKGEISELDKRL